MSSRPGDGDVAGPFQKENSTMNLDRAVLGFAGLAILVSVVLGVAVTPYFFLLTAFVGINLVLGAFSGVCFSATVFKLLGVKPGQAFR